MEEQLLTVNYSNIYGGATANRELFSQVTS